MSKAVTNEEVEDVLSSIRRLVSEDKRPLAGLRSAPVAVAAAPEAAGDDAVTQNDDDPQQMDSMVSGSTAEAAPEIDRLVLTPALRVQMPDPAEVTVGDGPLDLGSVARQTWGQEKQDSVEAHDEVDLPAGPMILSLKGKAPTDDAAMDALDALVHAAIEDETRAIETEIDAGIDTDTGDYADEAFWDDVEDDVSEQGGAAAVAALQEKTAHMESLETEDHHDDKDNWDLQEGKSESRVDPARASTIDTVDEAPFFEDDADEHDADVVSDTPVTRAAYIPLTAKIAALEAVIGGKDQEYEPDGDEAENLTVTNASAMAWEDDVELDAKGEPLTTPAEEAAEVKPDDAPAAAAFGGDDQVMDEETLRDLVSEIVRAELQGALGERITRNVRKLVRREIHRALTAQEME